MALKKVTIETVDRWGEPAVEVRYRHEEEPQINANDKTFNGNLMPVAVAVISLLFLAVLVIA